MTPAFLDTNVFLYTIGAPHPYKEPSGRILLLVASHPNVFVTDAEVFQEIIHRALAIRRWRETRPHFEGFLELMRERIHTVTAADVALAAALIEAHPGLRARDLIHLAVARRRDLTHIVTADRAFDDVDGITRLDPMRVGEWQAVVTGN